MIKWIGQHIWDFVSRFRNDVYLENIADGTVDSDKFLGLDSNNKIVKEAVSSGTTYTAGTGLDLGGTEFTVDVSDFMTNGSDNRVVTATGTDAMNAEANLAFDGSALNLTGVMDISPANDAGAAALTIDNDDVDQIALDIDAANTTVDIIDIDAQALTTGSVINIDSNSLVNGGKLIYADWDLVGAVNNAYQHGLYINIDKSGNVATGENNYIYGSYIVFDDNGTNVGNSYFYGSTVSITDANDSGTNRRYGYQAYISGGDANRSYGYYSNIVNGGYDFYARSSTSQFDYATWQTSANGATTLTTNNGSGSSAAHFEIAADGNITLDPAGTIALEADTTITGDLTVSGGDIFGPTDGDLNIKSDGGVFFTLDTDTDENNQMFTIAETSGEGSFEYNAGRAALDIFSSLAGYPTFNLIATTDDAISHGSFTFTKKRIDTSTQVGEDNDVIGGHYYKSYNDAGTPESITYAYTHAAIKDASDSDEAGKYTIQVATSNGTTSNLRNALYAEGSPSADDVDVTLGHGSTSTTTVGGGLVVTTGLPVNVASGSQKPIGMQIARRTITQAEANSMHSTPIELIPAQGANTIIEISNVIARADRAATQTASALTMDLHYADKEPGTYGAASLAHFRRFMYNKTTDIVERRTISQTVSGVTLTEDVNKAVEVSFSTAATTNCFTNIDMYVTYFVIDIS